MRNRQSNVAWNLVVTSRTRALPPAILTFAAVLVSSCCTNLEGLHWFRSSAERVAIYEEVYHAALGALTKDASERPRLSWGVILDIDETVLDNSTYQRRLNGRAFNSKLWDAWVSEEAAPALPGSKAFIATVLDQLGGQIILITNRSQGQCPATEGNLVRQGIRYSRILCKPSDSNSDKNRRFRLVMEGDPSQHIAPLNVLAWIGDNIQDFPNLSQSSSGDAMDFGTRYFVLPNPMYGSWSALPIR